MIKKISLLLFGYFCFVPTFLYAQNGNEILKVNYQKLISESDLTYNEPVTRSEAGMPVGNGRMGSLVWTTPTSIKFQINRVDIFGSNSASNNFYQRNTDYCGGAGFVDIDFVDFGKSVFEGKDFKQHLSCYDGLVTVKGSGIIAKVLAWNEKDVMAVKISDNRKNPKTIDTDLRMLRDPIVHRGNHTAESKISVDGNNIILTQVFKEDNYYCSSAVVIGIKGREVQPRIENETTVKLSAKEGNNPFTVFIASAASFDSSENVAAKATKQLESAEAEGFNNLYKSNKKWWSNFWQKSFVHLHSSDSVADFVQKNYNYFLYVMGSSSLGEFPPKFNGMLWTTGGDAREWGGLYWGANQSCLYNGLFPTNHMELMDPMFKMYTGMFQSCELAAEQQWGSKGIFIPETVAFNGLPPLPEDISAEMEQLYLLKKPWSEKSDRFTNYASTKTPFLSRWNWKAKGKWEEGKWMVGDRGGGPYGPVTHTFSRGAKIAYQYWQRYEYTLDKDWLRKYAYPMLEGIADFYRNYPNVKKEKDGKYHIYNVNDNEALWGGQNTCEEISSMMGIFPAVIKASEILGVDQNLRPVWKEFLDNLSPLTLSTDYPDSLRRTKTQTFVKALPPIVHGHGAALPDANTMPVWFFDLCNLDSQNPERLKIANATYDAYFRHGINKDTRMFVLSKLAVAGAILGRADATKYLIPNQIRTSESQVLANRMTLREGYQTQGVERLGRVADALNIALCQSAPPEPGGDPIIYVFSAFPKDWNADFKLLARGNFLVTSSIKDGNIKFVELHSNSGALCRLHNPWDDGSVTLYRNGKKSETLSGSILTFDTEKDEDIVVVKKGTVPEQFKQSIL
jgi:Glycosyl hydrolase family 95 catalytic domain/Domain of unknown function (DUF5703)